MLYVVVIVHNFFFRFEQRTQEATQLKIELDKAQETITAAETLVGKLEGEFKRWSGQVRYFYLCFNVNTLLRTSNVIGKTLTGKFYM
jgi:hypothetical protein